MDTVAGVSGTVVLVFWIAFALMAILLPFSAYAAQRWAYKTCKQVERLNATTERLYKQMEHIYSEMEKKSSGS